MGEFYLMTVKAPIYEFYLLPHTIYLDVQRRGLAFLILESQPFGIDRQYRIATIGKITDIQFEKFSCRDTGRTNGWFQNFFGQGILKTGKKPKLPQDTIDIIEQLPTGTVEVEGNTWAEIIESWYQKVVSTKKEGDK